MTIRCLACVLVAFGLLGCQSLEGHHEYDVDAPFQDFVSFEWVTEEPLIQVGEGVDPDEVRFLPIHEEFIRAAVERRLLAKGYEEEASTDTADLAISFTLGTREKVRVDSLPVQEGYRYGPYHAGSSPGGAQTYTEGTLAIDVFDNSSKQLVWQGWVSKRLSESYESGETEERINRVVDAILRGFPARGAGLGKPSKE